MFGHRFDVCYCGDYRRDHPGNGPCIFNHGSNNGGLSHGFEQCPAFKLVKKFSEHTAEERAAMLSIEALRQPPRNQP